MIEELMGAYGGRLMVAVLGVAIGLVCLVAILLLLRGRSGPSPFVRGGRNRNPRLQVLDAAAVDTRRRLVLVRRDDVEHLIMIGGPTDIVVESGIVSAGAGKVSADDRETARLPAQARPPAPQRAAVAPAEPRAPAKEATAPESIAREAAARPLPAPAGPVSAPPSPAPRAEVSAPLRSAQAAPAQAGTSAGRQEPIAPAVSNETPAVATAPASSAARDTVVLGPAVDTAASALDAVRARVIQERTEAPRILPVRAVAAEPALQQAADKPKLLGSDFEKILEEEMAHNLAAGEPGTVRPSAPVAALQGQPATAAADAKPEASLQDEVARIFGDISVTRDK